jgi:hypothetical protein
MTKTILTLTLLFSLPLFANSPSADYNITIHVSESRIGTVCSRVNKGDSNCDSAQRILGLIDGAKYELESKTVFPKGIVALGDYKAKLIKDQQKPTHEFNRTYSLMFPDGSTRDFVVTGQVE